MLLVGVGTVNDTWVRREMARGEREYLAALAREPCAYCGAPAEHIDHIVATAEGGEDDWSNKTAACGHCNTSKGRTSLLGFLGATASREWPDYRDPPMSEIAHAVNALGGADAIRDLYILHDRLLSRAWRQVG